MHVPGKNVVVKTRFFTTNTPNNCPATVAQERTVRALYWKEAPAKKAVMRATYFVRKGGGWIPYNEEDSETLEVGGGVIKLSPKKHPYFFRVRKHLCFLQAGEIFVLLYYYVFLLFLFSYFSFILFFVVYRCFAERGGGGVDLGRLQ